MIKKQIRLPIFFAIALIALGGLAYWDDWQTKRDELKDKEKNQLFTLKPEDITEFEYESNDTERQIKTQIKAIRQADKSWIVESPMKIKGDAFAIDNLLRQVLEYQIEERIPNKQAQLADYGLATPAVKITMKSDKSSKTLLVGKKTPVGYSVYSTLAGEPDVFIGSQYLLTSTVKTLHDFRDKALLDAAEDDVIGLSLVSPKGTFAVKKAEDKRWTAPSQALKIDQLAVAELVGELRGQSIQGFIDQPTAADKAKFVQVPADKKAQLQVETKQASLGFTFIQVGEETLAAVDPEKQIFKLSKESFAKFDKGPIHFYDKSLAEINVAEVKEISVQDLFYIKKDKEWVSKDGKTTVANVKQFSADVDALLNALTTAKGEESFPLDMAKLNTTGKALYSLSFFKQNNGAVSDEGSVRIWGSPDNATQRFVTSLQRPSLMFTAPQALVDQFAAVVGHLKQPESATNQQPGATSKR